MVPVPCLCMSVNYRVHNNDIILYNTILQCHVITIENDELELASRGRQSDLQCHFVCAGEDFSKSSMPRYVCVCVHVCVCVCTVCVCTYVCLGNKKNSEEGLVRWLLDPTD